MAVNMSNRSTRRRLIDHLEWLRSFFFFLGGGGSCDDFVNFLRSDIFTPYFKIYGNKQTIKLAPYIAIQKQEQKEKNKTKQNKKKTQTNKQTKNSQNKTKQTNLTRKT